MKKYLISFVLFLNAYYIFGQNPMHIFPNTFQINEITYKTKSSSGNGVRIENVQNTYSFQTYPLDTNACDPMYLISHKEVSLVVASKFSNQRVLQLKSGGHGGFGLELWINESGIIKYVIFHIGKNTMLTPLEIYNMEKALVNYQLPTWKITEMCPNGGSGYFNATLNMGFRPRE